MSQPAPAMDVRAAAVWAMAGQYCAFGVQFIASVVISRLFLGPAELGLFSIAMALALVIATIQDFGMARHVAALPTLGPADLARSASVSLLFGLGLATAIALAAWPAPMLYHQAGLRPILLVIALSYAIAPLSVMPLAVMSRRLRFHAHFLVQVAGAAVQGGVAMALAAGGAGAMALAWGTLAAALVRAAVAQGLCPVRPWPLRFDALGPILRSGSRLSVITVMGALGGRMPDMVVGRLLPLAGTGLFSRGVGLSDQFRMLIAGAVGQVFFPAFARIRDRGEPLGPAYLRVVAGYTAVLWPGMAGLALGAPVVVRLLYGPAWAGAATVLALVALLEVVLCALPLHCDLPVLTGHTRRLFGRNAIDTAASVTLLAIGCHWGLAGAAASRLVYAPVWLALYAGLMDEVVGFDRGALMRIYGKSLIVTLAALAPLALAMAGGGAEIGAPLFLASAALGVAGWLAALRLCDHPAQADISALAGQMRRFVRRSPATA